MTRQLILVDDDPVVNFVNSRILARYGLADNPLIFENGRQVLDYLLQNHGKGEYFLILLDINMPLMTGWEFLDALDEAGIQDGIEVFILTSSLAREDISKSQQYRLVKDYLVKPLNEARCRHIQSLECKKTPDKDLEGRQ